ncbi:hypothetical protein ACS0TY_035624 [Phlomoides rotata]
MAKNYDGGDPITDIMIDKHEITTLPSEPSAEDQQDFSVQNFFWLIGLPGLGLGSKQKSFTEIFQAPPPSYFVRLENKSAEDNLYLRRRTRMRRWLCCTCQVEESYHPHENKHLKSPRNNANRNQRNSKASAPVKPDVQKETPPIEVPSLSLEELKEKTDNFGSNALIGEGSYGRAYFAQLNDGKEVAVKKLDVASEPDSNVEFLTQNMVSRLKHDNLVELLGYCVDGNLCVLAYEFATMGSLHDILHEILDPAMYFFLKTTRPRLQILIFQIKTTRLHSTRVLGAFGYHAPE